jgi:hypothetical protein
MLRVQIILLLTSEAVNCVRSGFDNREPRRQKRVQNVGRPNQALQQTAATVIDLPGCEITAVAAAAELECSAEGWNSWAQRAMFC